MSQRFAEIGRPFHDALGFVDRLVFFASWQNTTGANTEAGSD